jgi:uncharacterized protein (TIGR02466 family)
MIHLLFPVPVYTDVNKDLVEQGSRLFDLWKDNEKRYNEYGFLTTLKEYDAMKGEFLVDFSNLPETEPIKKYIEQSMYKMLEENLISTDYRISIENLWINEMPAKTNHPMHNHYGYSYSGCFYVSCPGTSGKVMFHSLADDIGTQKTYKVKEYTPANSPNWWLPVEAGSIAIWPSYLKHSVPSEEFEGVRRSIAFDIILYPNNKRLT